MGTCDAAGLACVCDDPDHYMASEQCSTWHHVTTEIPEGGVCRPGDPVYCNWMGTCSADGMGCDCFDPDHFLSEEQCSTWHLHEGDDTPAPVDGDVDDGDAPDPDDPVDPPDAQGDMDCGYGQFDPAIAGCVCHGTWFLDDVGRCTVSNEDLCSSHGQYQVATDTCECYDTWFLDDEGRCTVSNEALCGPHGAYDADTASCDCYGVWCVDAEGKCNGLESEGTCGGCAGAIDECGVCDGTGIADGACEPTDPVDPGTVGCAEEPSVPESCEPDAQVTISAGTLDAGTTLSINNISTTAGQSQTFCPGTTLTFTSTYEDKTYTDVVDVFYDFEVSVHAMTVGGAEINETSLDLMDDLAYSPYDIYIIHQAEGTSHSAQVTVTSANPPTDDAVRILGMHFDYPIAQVGRETTLTISPWNPEMTHVFSLGNPFHDGALAHVAEVFYGTLENTFGVLDIQTTAAHGNLEVEGPGQHAESIINLARAPTIMVRGGDESWKSMGIGDILLQEVHTYFLMNSRANFSYWHLNISGEIFIDCDSETSFNTDWPEL